jgi:hypothetical protein
MINLWSIVRSPLVYGGDPLTTDAATLALLTNPDVIEVDQHSRNTKGPILTSDLAVYTAEPAVDPDGNSPPGAYIAIFNRKDTPQDISLSWTSIGLASRPHHLRDLWTHAESTARGPLTLTLAPHASAIYRVAP